MNRKIWISAAAVIAILGSSILYFKSGNSSAGTKQTVTVARATVVQDVAVTGKTKSMSRVDLAFERSGRVAQVPARTGAVVKAGQLLVQLETGELAAQYNQANSSLSAAQAQRAQYVAALAIQQAKLDEILAGTRPEEITLAQNDVQNAAQTLANYYADSTNTVADAHQKADDSVRTKTLGMFSGSPGQLYTATYTTCEESAKNLAEKLRGSSDYALTELKRNNEKIALTVSDVEIDALLENSAAQLVIIKQFLDATRTSISNQCVQNDTTIAGFRTNVNLAIASVVTAQGSIQTLQQNIKSQKLTVNKLQNTLSLKKAGAVPQQVDAQRAAVAQAAANIKTQESQISSAAATVQLYGAQLAKFSLRSPMDGTVTFLDIQRGELASPGTVVATVIAPNALEIEAQIPEVDVSKLSVGNEVSITFDAIGNNSFKGTVSFIDPAETVIDGVVNYKIKISLQTEDARVKSGLTANVIINAQKRENVLTLPEFALTEEDDGVYVQKLVNGEVQKTKVTMGMRGSNGVVEIIDGLSEGDLVESLGLK